MYTFLAASLNLILISKSMQTLNDRCKNELSYKMTSIPSGFRIWYLAIVIYLELV